MAQQASTLSSKQQLCTRPSLPLHYRLVRRATRGRRLMQEDKRTKVKKGWLAVRVGLEEGEAGGFRRFVIPISYLYHPLFKRLLDSAHEVYGYHLAGPLKLPCSVDDFLHLLWRIEHESSQSSHGHGHHQYLPLHSC